MKICTIHSGGTLIITSPPSTLGCAVHNWLGNRWDCNYLDANTYTVFENERQVPDLAILLVAGSLPV